jgi:ketosteroid isomerase-like protein
MSEMLKAVLDAFNAHDVEAIMAFFTEDCVMEMPRGPAPGGRRLVGKQQVREGIQARFDGIPDVHYGADRHWVCGDRGVSEWTLRGTQQTGETIAVRGCDLWEFVDGKISRKDSYWKIVECGGYFSAGRRPAEKRPGCSCSQSQCTHSASAARGSGSVTPSTSSNRRVEQTTGCRPFHGWSASSGPTTSKANSQSSNRPTSATSAP